jgi:hypothetical protein
VKFVDFYQDGAVRSLRFHALHLPGVIEVKANKEVVIGLQHVFLIRLPREYPQLLGKVEIIPETDLVHPRIRAAGIKACYTVNGEVDRVLNDIIFNVLLRPETVQPPSLYKDADWGLDSYKMKWYIQYGPERMYNELKSQWAKLHDSVPVASSKQKRKVYIVE